MLRSLGVRLLRRTYSTPAKIVSDAGASPEPPVKVSEKCAAELSRLKGKMLRVGVTGGGCGGFQYTFSVEPQDKAQPDDIVVQAGDGKVVVDTVSLPFLQNAIVDYEEQMYRRGFQIAQNPNAATNCSCKKSFSPAM